MGETGLDYDTPYCYYLERELCFYETGVLLLELQLDYLL